MSDEPMLRESAAAAFLDVSARTLARWRSDGIGPAWCQVGRSVRYPRDALERYVADRTRALHRGPER